MTQRIFGTSICTSIIWTAFLSQFSVLTGPHCNLVQRHSLTTCSDTPLTTCTDTPLTTCRILTHCVQDTHSLRALTLHSLCAGYSSNSLSAWFHNVGFRDWANDLVNNGWLGAVTGAEAQVRKSVNALLTPTHRLTGAEAQVRKSANALLTPTHRLADSPNESNLNST